jgi:protein TonB
MNTATLNAGHTFQYQGTDGARRSTGLIVVVVVHLLVAYALATGLARKAIEIVKKPIEMVIVPEEVAPPPPPPPPPKIEKIKEVVKADTPPPPYVPPPDITPVAPPPAPVIQAVQAEPPKAPVEIAPPPPPAPPAPQVVKQEISLACPGYQRVLQDTLADAFDRVGVPGIVKTLLKVRGSQIVEAVPLSGPKDYYKFVQAATKRIKCSAQGAEEVQVTLEVAFQRG